MTSDDVRAEVDGGARPCGGVHFAHPRDDEKALLSERPAEVHGLAVNGTDIFDLHLREEGFRFVFQCDDCSDHTCSFFPRGKRGARGLLTIFFSQYNRFSEKMQGGVCFFGKSRKIKSVWGGRRQVCAAKLFSARQALPRPKKLFLECVYGSVFSETAKDG